MLHVTCYMLHALNYMAKFKYKASKATGEIYEGVAEFPDKFALYKEFKKNGETILVAKEAKRASLALSMDLSLLLGRVKMQDKIGFARNLGSMIEAGLSLARALLVIERQTRSKKFKKVVVGITEQISKGNELSSALASYPQVFPTLFVSMVRAGEASGTVAGSLGMVASQMESTYLLKKKVRGAMIYPTVIICLIIVVAILMLVYVVPTLSSVFKDIGSELPFSTRMIIGTSDFLKNHWLIALTAAVAAFLGGFFFLRSRGGSRLFDRAVLHFPIIGAMVKEVNSARTGRTLSALISAGVDVVAAIDITKDVVQNSFFRDVLQEAKGEIEKGNPISQVFSNHERLYPPFVAEMISVGEETGKLAGMLASVAAFYENEVEQKTKNLSTVIEPLLMIMIGGAVGFFAYAMLTPIYSIIGSIQ